MKAEVKIIGQVRANRVLRDAIIAVGAPEPHNTRHGYRISFQTKKEARRTLWMAYRRLHGKTLMYGGLTYQRTGILAYDSSRAHIETYSN